MFTHIKPVAAVGFEPTPPKRLVPKTSALDRSAILPHSSLGREARLTDRHLIDIYLSIYKSALYQTNFKVKTNYNL